MEKNGARNMFHVDANKCVGKIALAIKMVLAVRSIVDAQKVARIGLEGVIVQKVSV